MQNSNNFILAISIAALAIVMGRLCFLFSKMILISRSFDIKKEILSINIKYIPIQLLLALAYMVAYWQSNSGFESILLFILATCLAVIIITDLRMYIIPDIVQFVMAINGIIYAYYKDQQLIKILIMPIFCFLLVWGVEKFYNLFAKKSALGMGDIKFFAISAIYLPVEAIANLFFISGILGVVMALIWRAKGLGKVFPFGPALAVSLYFCLLFPNFDPVANLING